MTDGRLEGIDLKDRTSRYRDGTRLGWSRSRTAAGTSARLWRFERCQAAGGTIEVWAPPVATPTTMTAASPRTATPVHKERGGRIAIADKRS